MDWELNIRHLISGYIPVFAALICYFVFTGKRRNPPAGHIILSFVFCLYLVGILTLTGVWFLGSFAPRIVYTPFADMIKGPFHAVLNLLLFIPLGVFLPMMYKRYNGIKQVAFIGFLISFSIELIQLFDCGTTDINDLITNTLGACLGYCISNCFLRILPESCSKAMQIDGTQSRNELLLFCAISFLLMITIQPQLYHLWFAPGVGGGEISVWKKTYQPGILNFPFPMLLRTACLRLAKRTIPVLGMVLFV